MNKRVLVALFLSVIFPVTSKALAQNSAPQANVATVGWFGPLSGPVASLGQQNLRGVELAIKDFGAGRVKLRTEDDQFSVKNSFSAYEKLKAENIFIMLSPTYNGVVGLAPKADRDKVFVANSLDASSEIAKAGEYVLGLGYYADGHGQNFARAISDHHAKRVAVFYNQGETFTQLIVNGFKEHYSGTIALTEGYNPSSSDFRSSIAKMKSLNVDTVLLIGWDETGLFVRQANDVGFLPAVFGLASFTSPGFLRNAGRTKLKLYCLGWDPNSKESQEIVRRYRDSYGEAPTEPLFVALGYDAMSLVLKAFEKGSTLAEFQSSIFTTSFTGLTGYYQLDRDGIVRGITSQNNVVRVNNAVD
jgi:branched-chain amino acid transport system substrate-binding protein